MCCPPSETPAATRSSCTTPSPDSDLTSYMEIQRWTLHTVTKLRAAQLASTDRVIIPISTAIDNFTKNNYTPGHKNCFTAVISNFKYARASLNKLAFLRSYSNSASGELLIAHHKNTFFPFDMEVKG